MGIELEELLLSCSLNCLSRICCVIEGLRDNVSSQSHVWSSNIDPPMHSSSESEFEFEFESESYKNEITNFAYSFFVQPSILGNSELYV